MFVVLMGSDARRHYNPETLTMYADPNWVEEDEAAAFLRQRGFVPEVGSQAWCNVSQRLRAWIKEVESVEAPTEQPKQTAAQM